MLIKNFASINYFKGFKGQIKAYSKSMRESFYQSFLPWASNSSFLSSAYYAFFSSAFRREHKACLYGQLKYYESLETAQSSSFLLRRNIHRLEKGLLMKPRRAVFAKDYITETVESYKSSMREDQDNEELKWARDVLSNYFSVVSADPVIDQAKADFLSLPDSSPLTVSRIPYKRNLPKSSISYDEFLNLSYQRRSVRWYLQKPVPRDLIDKAITAASLSPSACNRQPFEFRIFDDPDLVQKIASIPMGTKGFSHNFPVIVVVIGKLRAYFSERDRHVIYIDASLASMSFMYALETLGLSSCPINWPDIESKEVELSNLLRLALDERPVMLISLGFSDPEGMVAYSQKKSLDQLRSYNT